MISGIKCSTCLTLVRRCCLQALQAMGPVLQQHMVAGPAGSRATVQQQFPAPYTSKVPGPTADDKQVCFVPAFVHIQLQLAVQCCCWCSTHHLLERM